MPMCNFTTNSLIDYFCLKSLVFKQSKILLEHAFSAVQNCISNNLPISLTCTDLFSVLSLLVSGKNCSLLPLYFLLFIITTLLSNFTLYSSVWLLAWCMTKLKYFHYKILQMQTLAYSKKYFNYLLNEFIVLLRFFWNMKAILILINCSEITLIL